jgi:hypothetical protein
MRLALRSVVLMLAMSSGCGGDHPAPGAAVGFQTSECKTKSGQALLAAAQQVTPHDGLRCVTWERMTENVRFGLTNFEGGCGVKYAGQAFVTDGGRSVALSLTNPVGAVAACGWCVYDFVFEVKQVAADADLTVNVERSNSPERSTETPIRFQLPASGAARGVVCDYGNSSAMIQLAEATGNIGQRNWPCTGLGSTGPSRCQAGLTCRSVDATDFHRLCLADCTDDAGCGDAMFACRDGACQIRTSPR